MDIERWSGEEIRRNYGKIGEMMRDANKESQNPDTKKLTLHFPKPKLTVPKSKK
jgi:hypothetical protein